MGKWKIEELDKNKTEQSIIVENERLTYIRNILDKLKIEYNQKKQEYMEKLSNYEHRINDIEQSIKCGENYINNCVNHLKDFE